MGPDDSCGWKNRACIFYSTHSLHPWHRAQSITHTLVFTCHQNPVSWPVCPHPWKWKTEPGEIREYTAEDRLWGLTQTHLPPEPSALGSLTLLSLDKDLYCWWSLCRDEKEWHANLWGSNKGPQGPAPLYRGTKLPWAAQRIKAGALGQKVVGKSSFQARLTGSWQEQFHVRDLIYVTRNRLLSEVRFIHLNRSRGNWKEQ